MKKQIRLRQAVMMNYHHSDNVKRRVGWLLMILIIAAAACAVLVLLISGSKSAAETEISGADDKLPPVVLISPEFPHDGTENALDAAGQFSAGAAAEKNEEVSVNTESKRPSVTSSVTPYVYPPADPSYAPGASNTAPKPSPALPEAADSTELPDTELPVDAELPADATLPEEAGNNETPRF